VVPRERIDALTDDHSEMLEAHPVDALMDRRDELDEGAPRLRVDAWLLDLGRAGQPGPHRGLDCGDV
jgi:hypothetical protein